MSIELGFGAKCMRVLFILCNAVFAVIGLVIMSVGAWLYATGSTLSYVTGNNLATGAAIIIATGIFTFVLCAVGVIAAALQWRPVLGVYIGTLVVVIILEIVAGILGFVYLTSVNSVLTSRLQSAIDNYNTDKKTADAIDAIQSGLKCCGVNSYTEYLKNNSYFCAKCALPSSCNCTSTSPGSCTSFQNNATAVCGTSLCPSVSSTPYNILNTGCIAAWNANPLAQKITYVVGGFGIAVGLFEIIGVFVACGLICCITSSEKTTYA